VKTYQDAIKSLKELQDFAVQRNDLDMLSVISQAKKSGSQEIQLRVKNSASVLVKL
jgi:hypothetical protein